MADFERDFFMSIYELFQLVIDLFQIVDLVLQALPQGLNILKSRAEASFDALDGADAFFDFLETFGIHLGLAKRPLHDSLRVDRLEGGAL